MLVTLETQLIWFGREYEPGQQIDLPDEDAKRFLERGMATQAVESTPVETAAIHTQPPKRKQDARTTATRSRA